MFNLLQCNYTVYLKYEKIKQHNFQKSFILFLSDWGDTIRIY